MEAFLALLAVVLMHVPLGFFSCCCGDPTNCSQCTRAVIEAKNIKLTISGVTSTCACFEPFCCGTYFNRDWPPLFDIGTSGTLCTSSQPALSGGYCYPAFTETFLVNINYDAGTDQTTIDIIMSSAGNTWQRVIAGQIDCTNFVDEVIPMTGGASAWCNWGSAVMKMTIY